MYLLLDKVMSSPINLIEYIMKCINAVIENKTTSLERPLTTTTTTLKQHKTSIFTFGGC